MRLYDAHNHLQDSRLDPWRGDLLRASCNAGVACMVVNGACEEDWPDVLTLAGQSDTVLPSFGCHPWYVQERTPDWQTRLVAALDAVPSAIGEIGLDRWILEQRPSAEKDAVKAAPIEEQVEVFVWQLQLAAQRNLPASIHCLKAWGLLLDVLRDTPRPACGFLLHSYGGPTEMIRPLAELGAYFSLPGYYAHERKQRQRDTFKHVPPDRLLIETDAPDQCLPEDRDAFHLRDARTGRPLNHPANLAAVYGFAAELLGRPLPALAEQVEQNFLRLFGGVLAARETTRSE